MKRLLIAAMIALAGAYAADAAKIVSVKAVPSVLGWERAGKMPTPSLKDSNRL